MSGFKLPSFSSIFSCPDEVGAVIRVPAGASPWQRFWAFSGTGVLVAVGYVDPGNWATDIEAGSHFGYALLCVVLASSVVAMFLQGLCVRLGLATGRDLAQHCRASFGRRTNLVLWLLAEIAIIACDLAEVLGTALAFKLLIGLPLWLGVPLTAVNTVLILALQGHGFRRLEAIVLGFMATITVCYVVQILLVQPAWGLVLAGFAPDPQVFGQGAAWYIAIGILGATVMPHNLYLHSSIVRTRLTGTTEAERRQAISLTTWDSSLALTAAFLVNAAILVLSASLFHGRGHDTVAEIEDAYRLLAPLLGVGVASVAFAIALFASGQSATLTGTIAGQAVLEGFMELKLPCWQRRLINQALAIVPAWIGVLWLGEGAVGKMLVASQVVLSLQLPFAVIPLIWFTASRRRMGVFAVAPWVAVIGWLICAMVVAANGWMVWSYWAVRWF
jgi:manganese transport protein